MDRWKEPNQAEQTRFGGLSRSALMSRIRGSKNQSTEIMLVKLLRAAGIIGWRRNQDLFGRPDFVWRREHLVVFLDGCFWHGHQCRRNLTPATNKREWQEKLARNRQRDRAVSRQLRKQGWIVLRIWECHLAKNAQHCVRRIEQSLQRVQD